MDRTIQLLYFRWLLEQVYIDPDTTDYNYVLKKLFSARFVPLVANDDNRTADGIRLRMRFFDEEQIGVMDGFTAIDDDCSVLEMMIALAIRCEHDIMADPDKGDRTGYWFQIMLENLGLLGYPDENLDADMVFAVRQIIDDFTTRSYKKNGYGGLFPLKTTKKDQRKVEIWYQMAEYLNENFGF